MTINIKQLQEIYIYELWFLGYQSTLMLATKLKQSNQLSSHRKTNGVKPNPTVMCGGNF